MTDLTRIDSLRSKVEKQFRENKLTYSVDKDGDYVINNESTAVFVRPFQWNEKYSAVRIFAPVTLQISRISFELLHLIATLNGEVDFCRLYLNESEKVVYCCTELIGDSLSAEQLGMSVYQVAITANELDEKLSHVAGGKRLVDL